MDREAWYTGLRDKRPVEERQAIAVWIGRRAERLMREGRSAIIEDVRGRAVRVDGGRLEHGCSCCGYTIYGFLFDNGRVKAMRLDEIEEFDGVPVERMIEEGSEDRRGRGDGRIHHVLRHGKDQAGRQGALHDDPRPLRLRCGRADHRRSQEGLR